MKLVDLKQNVLKEGNVFYVEKKNDKLHFYSRQTPYPYEDGLPYTYNELIYFDGAWELKKDSGSEYQELEWQTNEKSKFQALLDENRSKWKEKHMFLLSSETVLTRGNDAVVMHIISSKRPRCYGYIKDMIPILYVEPFKRMSRDDYIFNFMLLDDGFLYSSEYGLLGRFSVANNKFSYKKTDLYWPRFFEVDSQRFVTAAGNKVFELFL